MQLLPKQQTSDCPEQILDDLLLSSILIVDDAHKWPDWYTSSQKLLNSKFKNLFTLGVGHTQTT